jgi:hypothetical protein
MASETYSSGGSTAVRSAFTHPTTVRDDWITLSDGCRLFARTVLPIDALKQPVPAVLEYLPYRLTDVTAWRDATHHPYFAGHGYASVRVDMRGSGNSDGILFDEYLPQEQEDACEVIAWLAEQPWCSGAVGMYGKSWGGFNGLQVAARRPPALRAVVSAYFTDDRYADDVHYMGGCVLGHDALSWASHMLGMNALPPDPEIVGERWREMWLARLRETPFFLVEWMRHQRRDEFWRQGSICEDYAAVQAPVLLIGGWADGYTNAVGRTLAGLTGAGVPSRAVIGPWSHGWAEVADPGPRIGLLQECVRWWDHWLRGDTNDVMNGPPLRAWMQEYEIPAAHHRIRRGRWVAARRWPPDGTSMRTLIPRPGGALGSDGGPVAREAGTAAREAHVGSALSGADAGAWCPYGDPTDFPPDQRAEDGLALAYTTEPLSERLEVFGTPELTAELVVDRPLALIAARLCDVAPDGRSLLVSRGLLNLAHRHSHASPEAVPVGEPITVRLPLDVTGHAFAPGHRIRLAISSTYWPFAWPSPETVRLELVLGGGTRLELPLRPPDPADERIPPFEEAERAAPPAGHVDHATARASTREASGLVSLEVGSDEVTVLDQDQPFRFGERSTTRFSLQEGAPLSARAEYQGEHFLQRGGWQITVRLRTSMSASDSAFLVTHELDAYEGERRVHATRDTVAIPRDHV